MASANCQQHVLTDKLARGIELNLLTFPKMGFSMTIYMDF